MTAGGTGSVILGGFGNQIITGVGNLSGQPLPIRNCKQKQKGAGMAKRLIPVFVLRSGASPENRGTMGAILCAFSEGNARHRSN